MCRGMNAPKADLAKGEEEADEEAFQCCLFEVGSDTRDGRGWYDEYVQVTERQRYTLHMESHFNMRAMKLYMCKNPHIHPTQYIGYLTTHPNP